MQGHHQPAAAALARQSGERDQGSDMSQGHGSQSNTVLNQPGERDQRSEIGEMRQEKPGEAAPAIYLLHHGLVAAEDPADADYALLPSVHLCPGRVRIVNHVHGQPAHTNAPIRPAFCDCSRLQLLACRWQTLD